MAVVVTRASIEATISTLKQNITQAEGWFGSDCYQVGRMREFLAASEQHLVDLDRRKAKEHAPS